MGGVMTRSCIEKRGSLTKAFFSNLSTVNLK